MQFIFLTITSILCYRSCSGRSKGFGFVEMEDEAEQQKVLDELKTVTVDGREVSIKVSVSVPHTTSTDNTVTEDASAATPAGDAE